MAPKKQPKPLNEADLYQELGVARDAKIEDIKRAYRRLALQCHPDKCPGDEAAHERFQRISLAYSVLSDERKRKFYDQNGTTDGLDISPDEFMDMFQSLLLEIIGGADMIRDMLSCFTPRELSRLPPFPFPKELFPPGTFPPGLRFSSKGLKGMPPQVEELIQSGDLAAMFSAMPESPRRSRGSGGRAGKDSPGAGGRAGRSGRGSGGGGPVGAARRKLFPGGAGLFGFGGFRSGESFDVDGLLDSGSSGGSSSSSDWTDVSEGELEAWWGEQHRQPQQPQQPQQPGAEAKAGESPTESSQQQAAGSRGGARPLPSRPQSQQSHAQQPLPHQQVPPPPPPPPPQSTNGSPPPELVRQWMTAARGCDVGLLAALLAADPRLLSCRGSGLGHTALHWCAAKGSVEGVRWLLQQGMDVNVRNDDGATPLHAAARNGRLEAVEELLGWRPDAAAAAAAPASQPGTAAALPSSSACAAASGAGPALSPACRGVCDLAARDGEGCSAVQLAQQFGHTAVVAALQRAAAAGQSPPPPPPMEQQTVAGRGVARGDGEPAVTASSAAVAAAAAGPGATAQEGRVTAELSRPDVAGLDDVSHWNGATCANAERAGGRAVDREGRSTVIASLQPGSGSDAAATSPQQGGGCGPGAPGPTSAASVTGLSGAPPAPETACGSVRRGACCGEDRGANAPAATAAQGGGGIADVPQAPEPRAQPPPSPSSSPSPLLPQQPLPQQPPPPPPPPPTQKQSQHPQQQQPQQQQQPERPADGAPRRSGLSAEEKAARRAALLAADAAAEREAARQEAAKAAAAEAAALAAGLRSRDEGRAWLEAARSGDLATLQRMLAANPRLLGYQGQGTNFAFTSHTALHWAAAKGHTAVARWLLQQGADPDVPNAAGATPLHAAASQGALEAARVLVLEGGAKMGVPDSLGETARDIWLRRDASGDGGSGGGSGARAAAELDLLGRVVALRDAQGGPGSWAPRAMRSALAAAGVSTAGLVEKQELVAATQQLIGRYPPRIVPSASPNASSTPASAAAQQPRCRPSSRETQAATATASPAPRRPAAAEPASDNHDGCGNDDGDSSSDDGRFGRTEADGADAGGPAAAAGAAAAVEAAKQRGNEAFARRDFSKAVSHYTMALRLCTAPNAVLYSNRSAAYCGMSYFGKAQADAEEAIRLEPQQPKYRCRLGAALLGQLQYREAEAAFRAALQLDPAYAAALQGLADVREAARRGGADA